MSQKKNFVLRIDEETFKALEKWATDEFRSVNGQIEYLLHQKLLETKRFKEKSAKSEKSGSQEVGKVRKKE